MFERLKRGISRSRESLAGGLRSLFKGNRAPDAATLDAVEELLLGADVGVGTTAKIITKLSAGASGEDALAGVHALVRDTLAPVSRALEVDTGLGRPFVILVVGVNGAGKTTTIAKLARRFRDQGLSVMLAAGDTFRAAAVEQLCHWGERNGVPVISQGKGADSASVVFDALDAGSARGIDVLIADTAGRLHTQSNLMQELEKIRRVIDRRCPGAPDETLLVVDATTGQNAINQVQQFGDAVKVSGLVLTKLDGSARGGIVIALAERFGIPVRFIGVGESVEDLLVFDADAFASALLGTDQAS
jgi:fused signal recognition particle receptor